ncbi:MAG: ATP-binding protein [Acidobacteriota bacterium]
MLAKLRRFASSIAVRLLAFNVLLLFVPLVGLLSFDAYERTLLRAQEDSMVQQGRLLAAALGGDGLLAAERSQRILERLQQRTTARLRVLDHRALPLADSSSLGPRREPGETSAPEASAEDGVLYRLGALPFRLLQRLRVPDEPPVIRDFYSPDQPFQGSEVTAALGGSYGSVTRIGDQAVLLYSAIPIRSDGEVVGVALVSQSTYEIQKALERVRLATFQVFLIALAVAGVVSLLLAATIALPLRRLRTEAAGLIDRRGRLTGRFRPTSRRDEIGDLTRALRGLSERLREHQQFSDSFAADVSHEFKNPLASIRSATEVLDGLDDPEQRSRFVGMVQNEVARMEALLTSLREVTRLDAGAGADAEPVDLIAFATALQEVWAARYDTSVDLRCEAEQLAVSIAPERLAQVLENLVDNAVSFTPPEEAVLVRIGLNGDAARIEVLDRGPGIPHEHLGKVFDRFFTYRPSSAATVKEAHHSGLGLAIVRATVEAYGGRASAAQREGGGARLQVDLPVASAS